MRTLNQAIGIFAILFLSLNTYAQYDSLLYTSSYRTYLLHLPPSYNPATPMPLIIAMHGGFGSGPQLEDQSQLSTKADTAGFIIVYPEGVKSTLGIRTWNAGGCCGYAVDNNINDVGFLTALIDTLIANYSIDTSRVYATGMSNGAFMSYRLACEISNKIAAIAPVAGTMNVGLCNPVRAVPVIHFHSYLDTNVPYQGGIGNGASDHYNPPLDSVLNVWSLYNQCAQINDTIHNDTDYTHINWNSCACGNELNLYITHDGGHSWPGGTASMVGDSVSTVINANDLMWDFFQKYSLNCPGTGIADIILSTSDFLIYPNPSAGIIKISANNNINEIWVFDVLGKKLETIQIKNNKSIEMSLKEGFYFLKIKREEKYSFEKIIISK